MANLFLLFYLNKITELKTFNPPMGSVLYPCSSLGNTPFFPVPESAVQENLIWFVLVVGTDTQVVNQIVVLFNLVNQFVK